MITSKISGNEANTSPTLIIRESVFPPKYPEISPRETPKMSPPVAMVTTVITTVFCIPHNARLKTSLPFMSVPAQC